MSAFFSFAALINNTFASEPASPWVDTKHASIRLVASVHGVGEASVSDTPEYITFGLEYQLAKDWKIYWRSPGDAGYPPKPDWAKSENISSVEMLWPAPTRFSVLGLETLGYMGEVVFPLKVLPHKAGVPIKLSGMIDYLICSNICVPETVSLTLDIPTGPKSPSIFSHLINKHANRVPNDGRAHGIDLQDLLLDNRDPKQPMLSVIVKSITDLPLKAPDAYIESPNGIGFGTPYVIMSKDDLEAQINIPILPHSNISDLIKDKLDSMSFKVTIMDGDRLAEKEMAISTKNILANSATQFQISDQSKTFSFILMLAFLGGLILNFMPCVLPVLSIKLLSVINQSESNERTIRLNFFASALGIIVCFLIISGVLIALKSAGAVIGWGIQFQYPWFLAAMMLVIVIFACNLWGWFEFRLPDFISGTKFYNGLSHGIGGNFLSGVLVTLLATPCSAPFLGTAVGFALAGEPPDILIVFVMLGVGLSTPYILVALVPKAVTILPKPGLWMAVLRKILGFALASTAVWLAWIMAQQIGHEITSISVACALGIMVIIFQHQKLNDLLPFNSMIPILILGSFAIIIPNIATTVHYETILENGIGKTQPKVGHSTIWQPFDIAKINSLVSSGNIVFVDITADWCITCKVNKALVLSQSQIVNKLQSMNAVSMQADWTSPNNEISNYLASFSRYGVPFNVVYGPSAPNGLVLPEILTTISVMETLEKASKTKQSYKINGIKG